ncbi:isochorismatase family protein [Litoribacterium kuwaitense]|uniref:isochorismatase family protein n=1 Tax=Litoribacterium kuwaitense TaxID=1398745 RepID=UPI0028ACEC2F|nr:isochorismatase family protein [Litoribacterium kuwaitense]
MHVQHASSDEESLLYPGKEGFSFQKGFEPLTNEWHVIKGVNSAFIGTGLHIKLRDNNLQNIVICGFTTPHCISSTVRMAANYGYTCTVVEDATAAFRLRNHRGEVVDAEEVHLSALAHLHDEFAQVERTETVLASLSGAVSQDEREGGVRS